jgi:dTDP-4-dehydrorhamnose 3,5-epimerase
MIFTKTNLVNAYIIEPEKKHDPRGFFARVWCQKEFADHDLISQLVQVNVSYNKKPGTLRGMHYQAKPFQESKLVRCTRGAIYDVIIDLRPSSPTYQQWLGVELTAENYRMLYVPEGFAHGFQTLEGNTEVAYQVSEFYAPQFERGVRYNDPAWGIVWPLDVRVISDKDRDWPDYEG